MRAQAGRSQLFPTGVSAASAGSFQRPVLVLLDRTADMCSAVQHSVSYQVRGCARTVAGVLLWHRITTGACARRQALVDDLLPLRLNRVSVRVGGEDKPRDVHLEADADAFWREHAGTRFTCYGGWFSVRALIPRPGAAFPEAIQAHSAQLERITREEAALRSQLSSHDAEDSQCVTRALPMLACARVTWRPAPAWCPPLPRSPMPQTGCQS